MRQNSSMIVEIIENKRAFETGIGISPARRLAKAWRHLQTSLSANMAHDTPLSRVASGRFAMCWPPAKTETTAEMGMGVLEKPPPTASPNGSN